MALRTVEQRLRDLDQAGGAGLLRGGQVGLEKESLRVAREGGIARTPHPRSLGSALTHPWITTDYSEALLEFITPPYTDVEQALGFLDNLHTYVYQKLEDELLWATSMPCVLAGDAHIPVAEYGSSHAGRMKHIYRLGLGYRYGRVMQVIAGVHYNYSLPEVFWPAYQELLGQTGEPRQFRDSRYMGMLRNLQRYGWLIPYLFGASPAVCKSFLAGKTRSPYLRDFDETTYFEPYATSLRLGDIGYQNKREEGLGMKACYNSLDSYIDSLVQAIGTPAPRWEELGVKVAGSYRQLNANLLQIENEYYSSVRPKQILEGMEKPVLALRRRGIRYVELRSLDVNAYHPLGVEESQLRFVEAFMQFCLLADSPPISDTEHRAINLNLERVAHRGREPAMTLVREERKVTLVDWADEILSAMQGICGLLDGGGDAYSAALAEQVEKVRQPDATPSARMLREMRQRGEGFYAFARRLSESHCRYFMARELEADTRELLDRTAADSLRQQAEQEAAEEGDFETFLQDYFAQA